jgi:outer membrane murein-binding lipoprotein Lpp
VPCRNNIQDEIRAIKEDLKTEISDLRAGQEDLRSEVSAMEVKINAGQAELEERVTDKLDKQLKGVTSMVEQQTRNLREGIEATRRDTEDTAKLRGPVGGGGRPHEACGRW